MTPKIVGVDKLPNGILVTFEDGNVAFVSAALLYATLPRAQQLEGVWNPIPTNEQN